MSTSDPERAVSLMQIAEPDDAPVPRQRKRAIGIDLGTTNSLVATVRDDGIAYVMPDADGRPLVPSIVHYGESATLVGFDAAAVQARDPQNGRFMDGARKELKKDGSEGAFAKYLMRTGALKDLL